MDYYAVLGMVIVGLGAIYTIYKSVVKEAEARQKPLHDLNLNIVKLSNSIDKMHENDMVRDKRIEKHGAEIDKLDDRMHEAEHELANHETRIKSLENYRKD